MSAVEHATAGGRRRSIRSIEGAPRLTSKIQKLYGREAEIDTLRSCLDEAATKDQVNVPLIFVGGSSGTGKTALVQHAFWRDEVASSSADDETRKCLFGCGKFELTKDSTPCGVLFRALREITSAMVLSPERRLYAKLIKATLSLDERSKLSHIIPDLALLLDEKEASLSPSSLPLTKVGYNHHSKEELEQLKFTIRVFIRTIAIAEIPVCLFLDDVQWMDDLTLDVLQAMLLDNELKHFVFVATLRSNEVYGGENESDDTQQDDDGYDNDSPHKVLQLIWTLKASSRGSHVKEIFVENLPVASIQVFLEDILRTVEGTCDLAKLFVERTEGNVFHMIQLLDHLELQGLLKYSPLDSYWKWDVEQTRDDTMATQNVAEILKRKIYMLSRIEIEVLKQCACLGYSFDENLLPVAVAAVAAALSEDDNNLEGFDELKGLQDDTFPMGDISTEYRDMFLDERLLERVGEMQLKFTHDKVHQAAMSLFVEESVRARLHYHLGMELYNRYFCVGNSLKTNEHLLFLCVDRLNSGIKAMDQRKQSFKIQLCRLNFLAAKQAIRITAFEHGLVYCKNGLDLLLEEGCNSWQQHYDLALQLHCLYARICLCAGSDHDNDLKTSVDLIVLNAKSIEDSMEARFTLLECYRDRGKIDEMVSTAHTMIEMVGEDFPKDPSMNAAQADFKKARAALEKATDDDILSLPSIEKYPLKEFCVRVWVCIYMGLRLARSSALQIVCVCRMLDFTLKYGLGQSSAAAIGCFSQCCLSEFFETRLATRMANLVVRFMEDHRGRLGNVEAEVRNMISGGLWTWHKPLALSVEYALETYRIGMRSGEVASACFATVAYGLSYFYCGLRLQPLAADMTRFIRQLYDYGKTSNILTILSVYQCALNLTMAGGDSGHEGDPTASNRESDFSTPPATAGISIFDIGGGASKAWRNRLGWNGTHGSQSDLSFLLQIAIYCRNFPLAVETKDKLLECDKSSGTKVVHGAFYFGLARAFYIGLVFYWELKKCPKLKVVKRKRYLKEARKYHALIREWVTTIGNINLPPKLLILDAEELSLSYKERIGNVTEKDEDIKLKLKIAYEKAIVASIKSGFTQDAALAAHLASETFPSQRSMFWEQARSFYIQWGAMAVVLYVDEQGQPQYEDSESFSNFSLGSSEKPFDSLRQLENSITEGSVFRARPRFSEVTSERKSLSTNPEELRLPK